MERRQTEQYAFGLVFLFTQASLPRLDRFVAELTFKQWLTLIVVHSLPAGPSIADIARTLGMTHQGAAKSVALLVRDGWLETAPASGDGRAVDVRLTDRTRRYFAEHESQGDALLEQLFSGVETADLGVFIRVLEHLDARMRNLAEVDHD